jgi:hypothetical protein
MKWTAGPCVTLHSCRFSCQAAWQPPIWYINCPCGCAAKP